jgi:hypothetical protein
MLVALFPLFMLVALFPPFTAVASPMLVHHTCRKTQCCYLTRSFDVDNRTLLQSAYFQNQLIPVKNCNLQFFLDVF